MNKPMVYLETSFFRYLIAHPSREEPKSSRQKLTRGWWQEHRNKYSICISNAVLVEFLEMAVGRIPDQEASDRVALLGQAQSLPLEGARMELAGSLLQPKGPLPRSAELDALHRAVAAYHGCEFVLTWNFKHLNNAAIKRRAGRIIRYYGYESPTLCSPEELEGVDMGRDDA